MGHGWTGDVDAASILELSGDDGAGEIEAPSRASQDAVDEVAQGLGVDDVGQQRLDAASNA